MPLQALSIPPANGASPHGLLVILHGWGANAQDVAAVASYLTLPADQLLFPNGPHPYPYMPSGRVWYNFPPEYQFDELPNVEQQADLQQSRKLLMEWMLSLESTTGVPLDRTVLAGFSQGGAMTMDVGTQLPLAGLMVLSGYLHGALSPMAGRRSPVLMVHGRQDMVVPVAAAHHAKQTLTDLGFAVDYHELDMGHEISPQVLTFMQNFTQEIRSSIPERE
ncbi:alpha/beta hydrolase [Leptolyngbya sp. AN02str]|uniref:alpha/beta hydrolase n=1 Tax=Leptolyngbya sp. AN02str TaxID=3423363 RepID=UPI003D31725E